MAKAYHRQIPSLQVADFCKNLEHAFEKLAPDGVVPCACGCSGTGAWKFFMEENASVWSSEYGTSSWTFAHKIASEINKDKQAFLAQHHNIEILVADVCSLSAEPVVDVRRPEKPVHLPHIKVFAGGFSCTDKSKENNSRKLKGGVRAGTGTN